MNTIVLWTLVALLTPLEAEKGGCPANCFCSTDNLAVKCRGLEKFPVFDFSAEVKSLDFFHCGITEVKKEELHAYTNLESLDLRYNELKSISPGLFSEITKLRELYIANNPWSCDKSSFILMQTEITALVDSNKNLEDFDGGKVECFDPPSMKGRRPLHLSNPKTRTCHVPPGDDGAAERHAARITAGAITMSIFVLVLLTVIIAGIWACRERIPCIRRFTRSKETSDSYGKMGAGGKSPLLNKMAKNQPVIEVLPRIPSHYDGRTVDFAAKENTYGALDKSVLIKNKKRFDKIQALPVDAKESANLLREKMAKKLHTVQVLPVLPKNFVLGQLKRTADSPDSNRGSEKGTLADKQAIYEKIQGSPVKSTEKKTSPLPSTMEKKRETLGLPLAVPSGASGPGKTLLGVTQPVGSHIKQSDRGVSVDSKERLRGSQSRQTHAESSLFIGEESGVFDSNKIQKGDGKIAPDKKTSLVERVRQRRLSISHSFHDMSSNSSLSEGETGAPHRKRKMTKRRSSPSLEGIDESLKERIKDRRRMSQALPELSKSSISSLEEDGECKFIQADSSHDKMGREEDLIDSTKKRRRMSQGLPVSAQRSTSSSEDDEEVKSPHTLGVETQELGGSESTWLEGIKIIIEKLVSAVKAPGTLLLGEGTSSTTRSSLPSTDLVHVQVEDAEDKEIDRESEKESEKESDDDFPSFHSLDAAENETD